VHHLAVLPLGRRRSAVGVRLGRRTVLLGPHERWCGRLLAGRRPSTSMEGKEGNGKAFAIAPLDAGTYMGRARDRWWFFFFVNTPKLCV
jgi:hypothetical protein